jgi:hypothetical protein
MPPPPEKNCLSIFAMRQRIVLYLLKKINWPCPSRVMKDGRMEGWKKRLRVDDCRPFFDLTIRGEYIT